jgi:hypothetical protein
MPPSLLPVQRLVDADSMRVRNIVEGRDRHAEDAPAPVATDHQWQAKTEGAFDLIQFDVHWLKQVATCPQGKTSMR